MDEYEFQREIANKKRFRFGRNWKKFSALINNDRIIAAEKSLLRMLGLESLEGRSFLDIGSGSGLHSLAARNLGARVLSFDYDIDSVACTRALKNRYYEDDENWKIEHGSVLDKTFLESIGEFEIVYSWGVLHHTGEMWTALENLADQVSSNGLLFVALYNSQPLGSKYWSFVKKSYNAYILMRPFWIFIHLLYPSIPSLILKIFQNRDLPRGMSIWYDLLDWLGGYPFEVSTPSEIFNFYKDRGFVLVQIDTVGGKLGCNEYVFKKMRLNDLV